MTQIILSKVGYSLPGRELFRDLDMTLGKGRQALVGRNGVGKSTLARIIAGELMPDEGSIRGSMRVLTHRQSVTTSGLGLKEIEEIFGRSSRVRFAWRDWLREIPQRDSLVNLSGGERMRLRLLQTLAESVRLEEEGLETMIILDEPSNDLDRAGRAFLREWIRARESGLLLISHDRELLEDVDQIFELSSLGLKTYAGGFTEYDEAVQNERARHEKAVRDSHRVVRERSDEKHEKEERQAKRSRQGQKAADRGGIPRILLGARKRRAEATTAKIHVNESERVEKAREVLREAHAQKRIDPFLRLDFEGERRPVSQVLVTAENLKLCWPHALTFQIRAQDRIHVLGANGVGKSSLLNILMGRGRPFEGLLWRAGILSEPGRVGYLDQSQSNLVSSESVLETISKSSRFSLSEIRGELAFYGFTRDSVKHPVSTLSGGERLRLALAQIFLGARKPALLVLDEPTNNLDFESIELLERAIDHFPGSVILVTHDEVFRTSLDKNRSIENAFRDLEIK